MHIVVVVVGYYGNVSCGDLCPCRHAQAAAGGHAVCDDRGHQPPQPLLIALCQPQLLQQVPLHRQRRAHAQRQCVHDGQVQSQGWQ